MRRIVALSLLVLAAACGKVRDLEPTTKGECTACHGGGDNQTGAPPVDTRGQSDASLASVGAHTRHVGQLALACTECHPDARAADRHPDGAVQVVFGPLARRGGASPTYASGTCSNVYCHGEFPGGNGAAGVSWTGGAAAAACGTCHGSTGTALPPLPTAHPALAASATQATCHACHPDSIDAAGALLPAKHVDGTLDVLPTADHPAGWGSPAQHGAQAAQDVQACTACHVAKGEPEVVALTCASCHDAIAGGDWTVTCNTCHGSSASSAPPVDTKGNTATTARGVGAHQQHLVATGLSPGFGCEFCHAVPADVMAGGHLDGAVTVTGYTGTDAVWKAAVGEPGLGGAGPSCGTAYCHGNFRNGHATNAPVWTQVGQGQAACGSCHGVPPDGPHPAATFTQCVGCHAESVDGTGMPLPPASGGKHLDGIVEAKGHDDAWMDQASPGFHAYSADAGLAPCMACHGADLSGSSIAPGCAQCHGAAWKTSCTMCHGTAGVASGAPPRATWGHHDPADRTNPRIGAHAAHLASDISPAIACTACHPARTTALDAGHLDGNRANVVFSGLATGNGALTPGYSTQTATCTSTYCHGGTAKGGNVAAPVWTGGSDQAACGACHGLPPGASHPAVPGGLTACAECHPATVTAQGAIIPPVSGGKHLDGTVQGGHPAAWADQASVGFHAFSANQGLDACKPCHGPALDGLGTTRGCGACHGGTAWKTTCTMCHGGTANTTGAPPKATWGHDAPSDATNVRIGAHTKHVAGTANSPAIACAVCHPTHASALEAGHADGQPASVVFSGLAGAGAWERIVAGCASTYCHDGGRLGSEKVPVWTEPLAAGCGSCHQGPPTDFGHNFHLSKAVACIGCHLNTTSTSTDPTRHVNGTVNVVYRGRTITTEFTDCTACHP